MVIFLLPGFDILCLFLLSFSIIVLLCLVFKVQVKYWYISLRRSLCGRGLGFTASTFFRSQYDGWTIGVSDSLSQTDCSASLRESCCRSSDTSLFASQKAGGDEENRTPDPLLARQVLSQLSYTPKFRLILRSFEACINWELVRHSVPVSCCLIVFAHRHWLLALTCSRKWRFNRKNAAKKRLPNFLLRKSLVGLSGLEPPTSRLSGVRSNRLSYRPIGLSGLSFSSYSLIINISLRMFMLSLICFADKRHAHSKINSALSKSLQHFCCTDLRYLR